MTEERTGEVFEGSQRYTVVGRKLLAGEAAPRFTLDYLNPDTFNIQVVRQIGRASCRERVLRLV